MLKIWGRANSINVQKVLWTVDELRLDHERTDAGLQFGVVNENWYTLVNPNRWVPVIDDDGIVVWESNAIVRYLTAKYSAGVLMPTTVEEQAMVDMWMDWQQTTIMPGLGPLFLGLVRMVAEDRDQAALDDAFQAVAEGLNILDAHLRDRAYVLGERFTAADIPLGCVAYRWYALDVDHPAMPHLRDWYERLAERPAYAKHVMLALT